MKTLYVDQTIRYTFQVPDDFPRTNEAADEYFCNMEDPEALCTASCVEDRQVSMEDEEGNEIELSDEDDGQLDRWLELQAASEEQDRQLAKDRDPLEALWATVASSELLSGAIYGLSWADLVPEQQQEFAKMAGSLIAGAGTMSAEMFGGEGPEREIADAMVDAAEGRAFQTARIKCEYCGGNLAGNVCPRGCEIP